MHQPADRSSHAPRSDPSACVLDFSSIHDEFRCPIHDYLLRLTGDEAEAEDLTQEVFVRVHRGLATFRGDASLKTWIYRIASNAFIDRRRSTAARNSEATHDLESVPTGALEDEDTARPEEASMRAEHARCIRNYVGDLPPDYRAVLIMHDMEGLTNSEIAEVLDCSLATAKIRLHRARERLKVAMQQGCEFSQDRRGNLLCDPKQGGPPNPHCT